MEFGDWIEHIITLFDKIGKKLDELMDNAESSSSNKKKKENLGEWGRRDEQFVKEKFDEFVSMFNYYKSIKKPDSDRPEP
jgi:hypothetical protein